MAIDTEVYFCKNTKLYPGSEDTYYFASESTRQSFFIGKSSGALHVTALSFQRKDRKMRVEIADSDLEPCDYLMFKNGSYYNKWFYAFITDVEYVNDNVSEVTFEIDPLQTWLPSLTLGNQFKERETTPTDSFADHKADEGLGVGQRIVYSSTDISSELLSYKYLCFAVKRLPVPASIEYTSAGKTTTGENTLDQVVWYGDWDFYNIQAPSNNRSDATVYDLSIAKDNSGFYQSFFYVLIPHSAADGTNGTIGKFLQMYTGTNIVHIVTGLGTQTRDVITSESDVVACFACPSCLLDSSIKTLSTAHPTAPIILGAANSWKVNGASASNAVWDSTHGVIFGSTDIGTITKTVTIDTSPVTGLFEGYTPQNKKCYHYPFVSANIVGLNGEKSPDIKPENVRYAPSLTLKADTVYNGVSVIRSIYADDIEGEEPYASRVELGDVPHFTFNLNSIDSWYATQASYQQQAQTQRLLTGTVSALAALGATVFTGGAAAPALIGAGTAAVSTGASMIASDQAFKQQTAQRLSQGPTTQGTTNGGTFLSHIGQDGARFEKSCCRQEIIKEIDNYFTMYGYLLNGTGALNFTGRSRFYFVKTHGLNASGSIPSEARKAIKVAFENGLRFWRGDYLGDYSVANSISS